MTDSEDYLKPENILAPITEIPEGGIPLFIIGAISYVNDKGEKDWHLLTRGSADVSSALGLLDRAAFKINQVADKQDGER